MTSDLIARLEALSGPDREVDAEIAKAIGAKHGPDSGWCNSDNGDHWYVEECAKNYTASIDSAMTLVSTPFWMIRNSMDGPVATIMDTSGREYEGNGDNAAIALCIAALKARSADNG
jgi:hypothetical protein